MVKISATQTRSLTPHSSRKRLLFKAQNIPTLRWGRRAQQRLIQTRAYQTGIRLFLIQSDESSCRMRAPKVECSRPSRKGGIAVDEFQRQIYGVHFQNAFLSKRGTEFQDWFARLAGHRFGADFDPVRPYGNQGDMKCDGFRISTGTVFQCYAPDSMQQSALIEKIDADFLGALTSWPNDMREWIFVHNDRRGLPPQAVQHLNSLRRQHASIGIEVWSEPKLLELTMGLNLSSLQALFGYVPSMESFDRLVMADLVPVIEGLARAEPSPSRFSFNATFAS